jgi:hypothetical protein
VVNSVAPARKSRREAQITGGCDEILDPVDEAQISPRW